ncbi:MAG: hypothetical protein GY788_20645 [bacterium]|nr:hypothetical protein [bacterium]
MDCSARIEWLFAGETDDFRERIRLAGDAGLPAVEFWHWRDRNLGAIRQTLECRPQASTAASLGFLTG